MTIGTAENRAFYDIAMRYKNAEGNWVEVDEANFPTGGVEVVLIPTAQTARIPLR